MGPACEFVTLLLFIFDEIGAFARDKTTIRERHDGALLPLGRRRFAWPTFAQIAVGMRLTAHPRTDPGGRNLRTGLLPEMINEKAPGRPGMQNAGFRDPIRS